MSSSICFRSVKVALLAEGVDRNLIPEVYLDEVIVALLAEGVDRNLIRNGIVTINDPSPSSRRAWIEMPTSTISRLSEEVALLAEGVDRNIVNAPDVEVVLVALLAEGVDRNTFYTSNRSGEDGRPPRGGRG